MSRCIGYADCTPEQKRDGCPECVTPCAPLEPRRGEMSDRAFYTWMMCIYGLAPIWWVAGILLIQRCK